jgi:hypothetical protein
MSDNADRITLLMQTGTILGFADTADSAYFQKRKQVIKEFMYKMKVTFPHCFLKQACIEKTDLYLYHFRLNGDIDLQMCPKFGVKSRIKDPSYIQAFGTESEQEFFEENGYIDEYFNSDYGIRLEWNPAKDDISKCSDLLRFFADHYNDITFDHLFKVSRLDIAVDYPELLNPSLFQVKHSRKSGYVGGSEGVETAYFGTRRSQWHWRIYDKKREYLEQQNIQYQGSYLWRIELESKPSFHIGEDTHFYAEIFRRLNYFYGKSTGDWKFDIFLHYAKCWGIQNALNFIPEKNTRKRYFEAFSKLDFDSLKHPARIVGWGFPPLWRKFYDQLREITGRERDPYVFKRSFREGLNHE